MIRYEAKPTDYPQNIPVNPRYVQIVEPLDRLTADERRILEKAFECRRAPNGRDEYVLKSGASGRTVTAAVRVVDKLHRMARLRPPEPPKPSEWRVAQYRQAGWKYDALAAGDSPVRLCLRGSTSGSRKRLAIQAVERVNEFRCDAPAWWFRVVKSLLVTD
jgi:hypothetical protein